jgi:hypothetical protein
LSGTSNSGATVTGVAQGTATVKATVDGVVGSASVTVNPVPPPPTGIPAPGPGATIVLDTRQSLQQVSTLTQAFALFPGDDHSGARPAPNGSGWSFTTNYDGQGTHALRADWSASSIDQGIRIIHYLPTPKPTELWVQWKNRLGKHPADPDGNGADNSYAMYPQSQACKRALFVRATSTNRVDYDLSRSVPEGTKVEIGDMNYERFGDPSVWNPNEAVGGAPYTTTVHVRAASSSTVADGVFQLWVDSTLLIDAHDVPSLNLPFDRWQFPDTCVQVPQPQSEYFWDVLVWTP